MPHHANVQTMECNGSRTVGTDDKDYDEKVDLMKERMLLPALWKKFTIRVRHAARHVPKKKTDRDHCTLV